jgi:hypothetical protein
MNKIPEIEIAVLRFLVLSAVPIHSMVIPTSLRQRMFG